MCQGTYVIGIFQVLEEFEGWLDTGALSKIGAKETSATSATKYVFVVCLIFFFFLIDLQAAVISCLFFVEQIF